MSFCNFPYKYIYSLEQNHDEKLDKTQEEDMDKFFDSVFESSDPQQENDNKKLNIRYENDENDTTSQ